MERKVKILGIAPYSGLLTLMKQYARQREDISLTSVLGNMENGVHIAEENYKDYDIIISRANTANSIAKAVPLTVIDIGIGYYDVLRCIKMAERTNTKFALISFPSLTTIARTICDLLEMKMDIFPISTASETSTLMDTMKSMNYQTVICDAVAYKYAKLIGLTPILLTTSIESLEQAVDNAVYTWKTNLTLFDSLSMMRRVLSTSLSRYLILDTMGNSLYSTLHETQTLNLQESLRDELPRCCQDKKRSFFITRNNQMYSILSDFVEDGPAAYVIFRVMRSEIPLAHSKYGITILDKSGAEMSFINSFYSNTKLSREILADTEQYSNLSASLMITGEIGTGKDRIAHIYYAKSSYCSNPLYVVNCALLSEKSWNFITNNYNSPFTDNGNTIYISNLEQLSHARQKQLLSIILDTNIHIRNRMIFSCSQSPDHSLPHVAVEYANALGSIIIPVMPLRKQREDIPTSASLYIDTLNQSLGKQVVGLDDDAIKLLMDYDFPYNRAQFKRILKEAILKTTAPYISGETIQAVLDQEPLRSHVHAHAPQQAEAPAPSETEDELHLDLTQPLDVINHDIIQYVLKKCSGNQSAAAKKLGISRTTLWRYLNR